MPSWSYLNLGSSSDPLQIHEVTLVPDPPQQGKDNVFTVTATAQTPIEEGAYLDVTVRMGVIKLISKQYDLLGALRGENDLKLTCATSDGTGPIPEGDTVLTVTVDLSKAPPAQFKVDVRGFTADDDDVLRLDGTFDFREP